MIIEVLIGAASIVVIRKLLKFKPKKSGRQIVIDMVPPSMHGLNVRSRISKSNWTKLAHMNHRKHGYCCEICGSNGLKQGFSHKLELHEIWEYKPSTRHQVLAGVISLCPACHKCIHAGLAKKQNFDSLIKKQFKVVNGWSEAQTDYEIKQAYSRASAKNVAWKLDLTYLNNYKFLREKFTDDEAKNCAIDIYV